VTSLATTNGPAAEIAAAVADVTDTTRVADQG
jgi:hypothetical protein